MKSPWTDFQERPKYFWNFFWVSLQLITKGFRIIFRKFFQKLHWNFYKVCIKMFFFNVCVKCFQYFFKVFLKFLCGFLPISLKLFQKNFLKFLHSINIISNYFSSTNNISIIFQESFKIFFSVSLKFLQNFLAIFLKFHQNTSMSTRLFQNSQDF